MDEKYTDKEYKIIGLMALGKWYEAAKMAEEAGQSGIILVMQRAHEIGFNLAMARVSECASEHLEKFTKYGWSE